MIGDPADHDPNEGRDDCPDCGSTDIVRVWNDRFPKPHLVSRKCTDCWYSWHEEA
ncbi:hypothetical protein [Streptomyces sp. 8L]|uniref:hypothetical protein n=1 Tax=Streptomyces sp. 8L TaxID=2877242 RepID=UPI001CD5E7D5|nr:hypothetical protein [Streptomyces sp. 8L]MCA1219283.1 hypothetical protein [Streptomyces sp. 8L]